MHRFLTALVLSAVGTPALALPGGIVDLGGSVLDTNTNLEWLALNVPARCSLDDISTGTPGCDFLNEGWTLASAEQVVTFLVNAGVAMGGTTPPDQDAIDLINALGPTNVVIDGGDPDLLVTEIWGITSTPDVNAFTAPFVSLFESRSGDNANFVFVGTADVGPAYVPSGPGDVVISYWFFRHQRGPTLTFSPNELDLGTVTVGARAVGDFVVTNTSGHALTNLGLSLAGPGADAFSLRSSSCPRGHEAFLPDEQCNVRVLFRPHGADREFRAMVVVEGRFENDRGMTVDVVNAVNVVGRGVSR
jgi:hypothetical protein